jgi:hypothetical protein
MAKKKSKGKKKKRANQPQNLQGNGFLGSSAQQIATTIAGLIATQLVEAIVEQITKRFPQLRAEENHASREQTTASSDSNRMQHESLPLEKTAGNVASEGSQAVDVLKSSVVEAAPSLGAVVDLFKTGAQQAIQKSENLIETGAQPMVETLKTAAQGVAQLMHSGTSESFSKKDKKKKKKK